MENGALSQGPHPGYRWEKTQETPEDTHPATSIVSPKTESVCSSFGGVVSQCFCQVNIYFLLALVTWKHEGGIVPLALDPTEVAHCWA